MGFRRESQITNEIKGSTVILPRNRRHSYGEKENCRTSLSSGVFWLVADNLMNKLGLSFVQPLEVLIEFLFIEHIDFTRFAALTRPNYTQRLQLIHDPTSSIVA